MELMDNTKKEIKSDEFNKNNHSNDYDLLIQKLKSIRKSVNLLEKNFLNKKI